MKCTVTIHGSVDKSIGYENSCRSDVKIFLDGLGLDGGAGAAAAAYKAGHSPKVQKMHLGTLGDYTMYEVEAVGLSLALHLLSQDTGVCTATIMLDNQAIMKSLHYHKLKPSQYLINGLLLQIENIYYKVRHPDFKMEIAWVKGHREIKGNEEADRAAKEAGENQVRACPSHPSCIPCSWSV